MNSENSFWNEPAGKRLLGCAGCLTGILLLLCTVCAIVNHCNRPAPATAVSPWLNNDPSRPVTDIKELDYNRRRIIYRDKEPPRQLRELECPADERMYDEPQNLYEDYYEELYEYFHD